MLRKFSKLMLVVAVLLIAGLVVAGCGQKKAQEPAPQAGAEKMKVGFVYIGTPGDAGWTFAHEKGRQQLVAEMPDIETKVVENVTDADAERVITQLAEEGCKVIFTTSFGFMDPTINVAAKYPDVVFMHCSGYKTAPNVGTYFGRMYQARYLTGLIAGKATKSNLIGYVAAFPIPEVIRGIDAFALGVKKANPDAKVRVVWTNTWFDPAREKQAAQALLDAGADVIAQHQDTPGPQQAAEAAGKLSIGYNSDMSKLAPKAVLTSAVWNWGPFYVDIVKQVKEGTWTNKQWWVPMSEGIVDLAPYSDKVTDEMKQLVEAEKARIISGEWDVFTGPIKDNKGELKVPEGQRMSDADMLSMEWFVDNVEVVK
ncbi:BMP family ABC transporter substrate-binding protein [Desulforudis sp. 1088]|uniref:BMP family ABC transporter substrate-binding protein n=1 Tax=unclassified Candidatus Desulforudis TaxID=2635950 RepID=UPI003CE5BB5F